MKCDRCQESMLIHTMSVFNTDDICMACKEDEKLAPGYARARQVEDDEVRAGNYNFRGVGLSPEDQIFLAERRRSREKGR